MNVLNTKYNLSILIGFLYVFFNSCFLPNGMYCTMLLFPFFLYNSLQTKIIKPYFLCLGFIFFYYWAHFTLPLSWGHYLNSNLITLLNITFLINCFQFFKKTNDEALDSMFKKIIYFNFLMIICAIAALFIPFLKPIFWYLIPITKGSGIIPRLKMFQSEASIYSLMITPLFLYFFFGYLKIRKLISLNFFLLLFLPLLLSFSFGVGLAILFSIVVTIFVYHKHILSSRTIIQVIALTIILFVLMATWIYFDNDNLVVLRFKNIISGNDTSANGRTFESFIIASKVLHQYNSWLFGIGPGQFKILGKELLLSFYKYSGNVSDIRIPNACADTLIVYGISGLILRLVIQIFLFFKTAVYKNYFRFALFIFLFVYQFTGSYFNNLIEWTMWVIVFLNAFFQFNLNKNTQA